MTKKIKVTLNLVVAFFILQCSILSPLLRAQTLIKPVIAGDFADPSVIKVSGKFYAVGTSSEWAPHFPVYVSTNLKDWKLKGYVFNKAPEWTSGSFWAPEFYKIKNTYYVYYTARRKKDNVSYIGVATSKYPDKGYTDYGAIVEFGKEAIDAFVYNDEGQLYITFKAYGLDKRPIEILGSKLSADGLRLEGKPFSMMKDEPRMGMEGQSILKKDNFYYLFYSAGNCCGIDCSYNVRVARSKKFSGPYETFKGNPILEGGGNFKCAGHGTFVNAGNKRYYLHHAYNKQNGVFTGRQGMLAELIWPGKNEWPKLKETETTQSMPMAISDSFDADIIAKYWQWDFRNATPAVRQHNGSLFLSGSFKSDNQSGVVITTRPVSDDFTLSATVINNNNAMKGLALYGDASAAIGIGTVADRVVFWEVRDNKRSILAESAINHASPVELKLTFKPDDTASVYYKQGDGDWKALAAKQPVSVKFLPQWDRSPRAGLHFKGEPHEQAQFSEFSLESN